MKKFILFSMFLVFLAGCTAAIAPIAGGAGAIVQGYIMWKEGEATKYYNTDVDTVYRAVKHAANQLNLKLVNDDQNKNEKGYHLKVGDKDKFKIKILPKDKVTELCIRVNFTGDKSYAELFYKTVDDDLNTIQFKNGKPVKERPKLLHRRNET